MKISLHAIAVCFILAAFGFAGGQRAPERVPGMSYAEEWSRAYFIGYPRYQFCQQHKNRPECLNQKYVVEK